MGEVKTLTPPIEKVPAFCLTPTADNILRILTRAQSSGLMAVIIGAPGAGKTVALTRYAAENRNVYLATMSPSRRTHPAMLRHIASVVDTMDSKQAMSTRNLIVGKLRQCYPYVRPALLIDEAQHLKIDALEELRSIHDQLKCGLVLAGNATFYRTLFAKGERGAAFAQITSRFAIRIVVETTFEDIDAICAHHGLAGKRTRDLLIEVASHGGNLRAVGHVLELARDLAEGRPIEPRHLEEAATLQSDEP